MGRHFRGYVSAIWRFRQSVQDLSQYTSEEVNAYSAFPPAIQESPALILAGAASGSAWQARRLPVESNAGPGSRGLAFIAKLLDTDNTPDQHSRTAEGVPILRIQ